MDQYPEPETQYRPRSHPSLTIPYPSPPARSTTAYPYPFLERPTLHFANNPLSPPPRSSTDTFYTSSSHIAADQRPAHLSDPDHHHPSRPATTCDTAIFSEATIERQLCYLLTKCGSGSNRPLKPPQISTATHWISSRPYEVRVPAHLLGAEPGDPLEDHAVQRARAVPWELGWRAFHRRFLGSRSTGGGYGVVLGDGGSGGSNAYLYRRASVSSDATFLTDFSGGDEEGESEGPWFGRDDWACDFCGMECFCLDLGD
ncbi:hypothetical protein CC80DRAFT_545198 [Byssothecium circinans]|uniref:Uncharacterized protein n=1 Tax=Byssothecium circinans TaxID=147558 RepID=A0A6A5U4Y7_9PLEO|nr:hypothetical protein CC80DRAFT_545198 [Byssothecium circinans]